LAKSNLHALDLAVQRTQIQCPCQFEIQDVGATAAVDALDGGIGNMNRIIAGTAADHVRAAAGERVIPQSACPDSG